MASRFLHWTKLASGRERSEDRAEVFARGDELVVVVADGAGGMSGGARASATVVEMVRAVAESPALDVRDPDTWTALLKEADATLAARAAGETTAVIAVVSPLGLLGFGVGDSEAWLVGRKSLDDLTRSQERARIGSGHASPVAFQRASIDGVLVMATDGLFKYASAGRIAATVRDGEVARAADRLTALVQLPSGGFQDDLALVVVAPG